MRPVTNPAPTAPARNSPGRRRAKRATSSTTPCGPPCSNLVASLAPGPRRPASTEGASRRSRAGRRREQPLAPTIFEDRSPPARCDPPPGGEPRPRVCETRLSTCCLAWLITAFVCSLRHRRRPWRRPLQSRRRSRPPSWPSRRLEPHSTFRRRQASVSTSLCDSTVMRSSNSIVTAESYPAARTRIHCHTHKSRHATRFTRWDDSDARSIRIGDHFLVGTGFRSCEQAVSPNHFSYCSGVHRALADQQLPHVGVVQGPEDVGCPLVTSSPGRSAFLRCSVWTMVRWLS